MVLSLTMTTILMVLGSPAEANALTRKIYRGIKAVANAGMHVTIAGYVASKLLYVTMTEAILIDETKELQKQKEFIVVPLQNDHGQEPEPRDDDPYHEVYDT